MTGSTQSLFGRVLFASKGEAAPAPQPPTAPRFSMPITFPRAADNAAGERPTAVRRTSSPLSFLITRRAAPRPAHGPVANDGAPAATLQLTSISCAAPVPSGRQLRRSLTVRLAVGDYVRFRECATRNETTFQSLLEALALRYLASGGTLPTAAARAPQGSSGCSDYGPGGRLEQGPD